MAGNLAIFKHLLMSLFFVWFSFSHLQRLKLSARKLVPFLFSALLKALGVNTGWTSASRSRPESCMRTSPAQCVWKSTATPTCSRAATTFARLAWTTWGAREKEATSAARSAGRGTAVMPPSKRTWDWAAFPTTTVSETRAVQCVPGVWTPWKHSRLSCCSKSGASALSTVTTAPLLPERHQAPVQPAMGKEIVMKRSQPPPVVPPVLLLQRLQSKRA